MVRFCRLRLPVWPMCSPCRQVSVAEKTPWRERHEISREVVQDAGITTKCDGMWENWGLAQELCETALGAYARSAEMCHESAQRRARAQELRACSAEFRASGARRRRGNLGQD